MLKAMIVEDECLMREELASPAFPLGAVSC